jgi:aconitate hydratase 2/2-methylisocitrate dehydratase
VCIGNKIAPIFFNTMEDSGALPIEMDVSALNTGDVIDIYPYRGEVKNNATGELVSEFELKTNIILDEVRAGGRIPLIIGRGLTDRARKSLGLEDLMVFELSVDIAESTKGYTLAQKMVGKACGSEGVRAG